MLSLGKPYALSGLTTSGIYILVVGGGLYVGGSSDILQRIITHRSNLINHSHSNSALQIAVDKHGIKTLRCGVIIECTILELKLKEITIIHGLSVRGLKLYNHAPPTTYPRPAAIVEWGIIEDEIMDMLKGFDLLEEEVEPEWMSRIINKGE